nr:efflux RND transporter periplasmic adaptor subunit [Lentibacillus saliphilus]
MVIQPGEVDELNVDNGDTVEEDEQIAIVNARTGKQTLKAPTAGTIIQLDKAEGDLVATDSPFAVIANLDELTIQLSVTASVRDLIEKETTYDAVVDNGTYEAAVTSIGIMPNDQGLYPVELKMQNEDRSILPGMVVTVNVPEKRVDHTILVPTAAIVEETDGAFVYIVSDGRVTKTKVDIADVQSDQTAIESGVKAGDEIVVNGQLSLQDKSEVNVVKEGASS